MKVAVRQLLKIGAAVLAVSAMAPAYAADITLRAVTYMPSSKFEDSMVMFKSWADKVKAKSDGKVEVKIIGGPEVFPVGDQVNAASKGLVDVVLTFTSHASQVPEVNTIGLSDITPQEERQNGYFDLLDESHHKINLKLIGRASTNSGFFIFSRKPISDLDDFKGMKIRLQPNEVHLATFRALGANPVSMDVSELYSALQQGVLDGQENTYNIIATRRFVEVQDHLSDTGHFYDFINVVANKRQFEQLSPEHQEIIRTAMKNAMDWQREEAARLDESWREKLIAEGITFTPISDDLRSQLRDATSSVADLLKKRIDPDIIDSVIEEASS